MENDGSITNDLEMHASGRNENLKVMGNKSSKSHLFDGNGQLMKDNEQVGGNGVT